MTDSPRCPLPSLFFIPKLHCKANFQYEFSPFIFILLSHADILSQYPSVAFLKYWLNIKKNSLQYKHISQSNLFLLFCNPHSNILEYFEDDYENIDLFSFFLKVVEMNSYLESCFYSFHILASIFRCARSKMSGLFPDDFRIISA